MEDIVAQYGTGDSDSDNGEGNSKKLSSLSKSKNKLMRVSTINSAPFVTTSSLKRKNFTDLNTKVIKYNPRVEELFEPIKGPLLPNQKREEAFQPKKTTLTGHVEINHFDHHSFDEQYHTFMNYGYALNPSRGLSTLDTKSIKSQYIGNKKHLKENKAMTVFNMSNELTKKRKIEKTRKRFKNDNAIDMKGFLGPWGREKEDKNELTEKNNELEKNKEEYDLSHPSKKRKLNPRTRWELSQGPIQTNTRFKEHLRGFTIPKPRSILQDSLVERKNPVDRLTEKGNPKREFNPDRYLELSKDEKKELKELQHKERYNAQIKIESTIYHGTKPLMDYQGRSYIYCPPERRRKFSDRINKYYIPKRRIHTYVGHKKGVNAIEFFPKTGHLILSCSNDTTVKIWDVYNKKECLRTYKGHTAGIRNIQFTKDGTKFITTSFDRWLKLYDTEYGKVIWRGTSGKIPFKATFYPENENEFLVGQKNKVLVQWDIRANKIVQLYEEHLQAVNAILFIDNNRRFISTSDDKKIFVWDYGVPVVIKHISEPVLHSVPYLSIHPNEKFFIGQSLDNQIVSYEARGRYKQLYNKTFKGHISAGYAIQASISPDGRFVMSGDAQGRIFFWDWKTTKKYNSFKAHEQVVMGAVWHPVMPSKVATCSWDGTIRFWD